MLSVKENRDGNGISYCISVDTVGTLRHSDEKGEPVMVTDNEQKANVFAVQFSKVFTREPEIGRASCRERV